MKRRPKKSFYQEPSALRDVVPGVLRELRPHSPILARLRKAWADVVGEDAAVRTRPAGLEQGVLTVHVASAALKHHLSTFRRDEILDGLRRRVPGVPLEEVRFRVGDLS